MLSRRNCAFRVLGEMLAVEIRPHMGRVYQRKEEPSQSKQLPGCTLEGHYLLGPTFTARPIPSGYSFLSICKLSSSVLAIEVFTRRLVEHSTLHIPMETTCCHSR